MPTTLPDARRKQWSKRGVIAIQVFHAAYAQGQKPLWLVACRGGGGRERIATIGFALRHDAPANGFDAVVVHADQRTVKTDVAVVGQACAGELQFQNAGFAALASSAPAKRGPRILVPCGNSLSPGRDDSTVALKVWPT